MFSLGLKFWEPALNNVDFIFSQNHKQPCEHGECLSDGVTSLALLGGFVEFHTDGQDSHTSHQQLQSTRVYSSLSK